MMGLADAAFVQDCTPEEVVLNLKKWDHAPLWRARRLR